MVQGRLKIFFGYAAGVGKTYAMLDAALDAKKAGIDVVAGFVDTHQRPQTKVLLDKIEKIPVLQINAAQELNADAVIERKPQLVLVDDLAHVNDRGCRHLGRYQDVEELLKAGINVYTTVNLENIESLNDIVASVTGKPATERIPDSVFDQADQVELIDIEPRELIARETGKLPEEDNEKTGMLTALREIALRRCADRVNRLNNEKNEAAGSEFRVDEHILVCLSPAPSNAKIIRTAARMAAAFKGSFTALYVETPDFGDMQEEEKKRLWENMHLAQQLGAQIQTVYGSNVPQQIAEFAKVSNVSRVVIGRSNARTGRFSVKKALTEKLIENAPDLDIYIIPDGMAEAGYRERKTHVTDFVTSIRDGFRTAGVILLTTLIGFAFSRLGFTDANIITVYILGVLIISVITSNRFYSLIASAVSVLMFNFFFTVPRFTFRAYENGYPVTFAVMFLAAFIMGSLAAKLKDQARESAQSAYWTRVLFDTNQLLQKARGKEKILSETANQLVKLLQKNVIVYPVQEGKLGKPSVFLREPGMSDNEWISEEERKVAQWAFRNGKHAGATTDTFSASRCLYLTIRINQRVYGVVGIVAGVQPLDVSENSMLLSILGECALALENERNAAEKEEAAIAAKNEQLRANLLRTISHDLRTPLTSISGNASNLLSNADQFDATTRKQIYTDIYDDSMWLITLVENLLAVTRIEEGHMNISMTCELMEDVIAESLRHINRKSVEHHITVSSDNDLILARMDARLIIQMVINIVDNAIKYTPAGSEISIRTWKEQGFVHVSIADNGPGIPDEVKAHVFEMFYRGKNKIADSRRSLGLGLALCRSIAGAHGGEITVTDNIPHGAVFTFTLPAAREVKMNE
ncbi:MAG: sensor histidine kinase KdpD [Butyrivibrio sp.]|jgi:two-component system sensor histidine kinase KdpD|nr:sensor histidine kinase KdpD [Butyrivibrio sp.]